MLTRYLSREKLLSLAANATHGGQVTISIDDLTSMVDEIIHRRDAQSADSGTSEPQEAENTRELDIYIVVDPTGDYGLSKDDADDAYDQINGPQHPVARYHLQLTVPAPDSEPIRLIAALPSQSKRSDPINVKVSQET